MNFHARSSILSYYTGHEILEISADVLLQCFIHRICGLRTSFHAALAEPGS